MVMAVWCKVFELEFAGVGCDNPMQIVTAVWCASNLKKMRQTAITICRGLSHPTRSLSRIVCRGQEGPKDSKDTLRPDFQVNTRPRIFFKANVTTKKTKIQEDSCKEIQVYLINLRLFLS
jgi:hypothetical protein